MRDILIAFGLLLVTSGCCDSNKGCCGKPPDPSLTPEAEAWMKPYQEKTVFVYQNEHTEQDTLVAILAESNEYYGGDECLRPYQTKRVRLTSRRDTSLHFTLGATFHDLIGNTTPYERPDTTLIWAELRLFNRSLDTYEIGSQAEYISDYNFQAEAVTAVKIECRNASTCKAVRMPLMVIAKERGLIQFKDKQNKFWTLIQ